MVLILIGNSPFFVVKIHVIPIVNHYNKGCPRIIELKIKFLKNWVLIFVFLTKVDFREGKVNYPLLLKGTVNKVPKSLAF